MGPWRKSSYSCDIGNCVEAASWRKASYSFSNGNCAEVAAWRKSARSVSNGDCVEAGTGPAVVGVRDSKDHGDGPVLTFSTGAWERFITALKA
jgi:hypothetical protein